MPELTCPGCGVTYDFETRRKAGPFHFLIMSVHPSTDGLAAIGHWHAGLEPAGELIVRTRRGASVRVKDWTLESDGDTIAGFRGQGVLTMKGVTLEEITRGDCVWAA